MSKKENRGIALAFALVLLSLLLVIGVSFVILSSNDRTSSSARTNSVSAKLLVQSAVARARLHLLQEINSRPAPESVNEDDTNSEWHPVAEHFVSLATKEEKKHLQGASALTEDLDRLLIQNVENISVKPQWNYIFSPDIPSARNVKSDERRVVGRFAFIGFGNSKVSLASTLDSAYDTSSMPDRFGYSVREIRPGVIFTQDDAGLLEKLVPKDGGAYVQPGSNRTEQWPDLTTVARQLGYNAGTNAGKVVNLYDNFAIGKLPCPEMWRMPTYGKDITGNKLKAYHRFNIHKSQEEWNNFDVERMWNYDLDNYAWVKNDGTENFTPADKDVGLYYFSGLKPAPLGNLSSDQVKKQLLANLKDYNDDDVVSTVGGFNYADGECDYSGIEAIPYANDMRLYYALAATENGNDQYTVSSQLMNIEIEMNNFYFNPELNLEEMQLDFYSDFTATVNGEEMRTTGRQRYLFKRTTGTETTNFTNSDVTLRGSPTGGRRPQPYFCLRDNSENCIEEPPIETRTISGRPVLTKFVFHKLIVVVRGKGTFRGKPIGNSGGHEILSIARPIHGVDIPQTLSQDVINNQSKRYFVNIDIDDPRCNLLAYGWSDLQNDGHKGYAVYRFSAAVNKYHWGAGATINVGTTTYYESNYENHHVSESEVKDNEAILGIRCRDPEYDVISGSETGHTYGNYRGHIAYMSTSFMRNAPMISPWELGFIHRVRPWQTLNLKRFNRNYPVTMDFSCRGYVLGDAAILDQIKTTKDYISYGKINMNTASRNTLRALLADVEIGGTPWVYNKPMPKFTGNIPPTDDPLFYGRDKDLSDKEMTVERNIRKNGVTPMTKIPESDIDRYAESMYKYIQEHRRTNWYSRAWIVNALRLGDIDIVNDLYAKNYKAGGGRSLYDRTPDMAAEEIAGKIATLVEGENGREVTVLAVAQTIQDARNTSGNYGTYEQGVDRIVGECKVLATFEYWPKLTKAQDAGENVEFRRSDWVLTRLVYLEPTATGL